MPGLTWTVAVWGLVWLALSATRRFSGETNSFMRPGRIELATGLALLATHSFGSSATAEDVIANPLAIERAIRGVLAASALAIVIPVLLNRSKAKMTTQGAGLIAITLYGVVATLSSLYSVAPTVTAGKAFELGGAIAILWAVATHERPVATAQGLVRFVLALQGALIVVAILGFVLLPDTFSSVQNRPGFLTKATMVSPYMHSNSLSAWSAIISAFSLAQSFEPAQRKKTLLRFGFLAGLIGVVLSSGRQGLVMWLAAIAVVMVVHRSTVSIVMIAPLSAFIFSLYWQPIWESVTRNQATVNLTTLSGRTVWWASALEGWAEHPWLGFGFGAGGRFVALDRLGDGYVSSVHSGYLEALIGVGLIGFVLLLYAIWRMLRWSVANIRSRPADAILAIPLVLHTFVSLGFGAWLQAGFFLFGLIVVRADFAMNHRGRMREPSLETAEHPLQERGVLISGSQR